MAYKVGDLVKVNIETCHDHGNGHFELSCKTGTYLSKSYYAYLDIHTTQDSNVIPVLILEAVTTATSYQYNAYKCLIYNKIVWVYENRLMKI